MSVSSISSSGSLSQSLQAWQARTQKIQSEFQQLGQDLQAGKLSQAQADFRALSQNVSGPLQSNSALAQAFGSLGSALKTGSLSAAQQAYTTLQEDIQQAGQGHPHHHAGSSSQNTNSSAGNALSQLFSILGSALLSGNLSAAQTAYSTLSQGLAGFSGGVGSGSQPAASAVSLVA